MRIRLRHVSTQMATKCLLRTITVFTLAYPNQIWLSEIGSLYVSVAMLVWWAFYSRIRSLCAHFVFCFIRFDCKDDEEVSQKWLCQAYEWQRMSVYQIESMESIQATKHISRNDSERSRLALIVCHQVAIFSSKSKIPVCVSLAFQICAWNSNVGYAHIIVFSSFPIKSPYLVELIQR